MRSILLQHCQCPHGGGGAQTEKRTCLRPCGLWNCVIGFIKHFAGLSLIDLQSEKGLTRWRNRRDVSRAPAVRGSPEHTDQVSGCRHWVVMKPFPDMGTLEEDRLGWGGMWDVRLTKLSYRKTPGPGLAKLVVLKKCSFTYPYPTFSTHRTPTTALQLRLQRKTFFLVSFIRGFCYSHSIREESN